MLKRKLYLVNQTVFLINTISFVLIFGSGVLYVQRVYKEKIEPSLSTWTLLSLISLLMLVSYGSSEGADENLPILLFDFAEPVIVTLLIYQKINGKKASKDEKIFIGVTLVLLVVWAILNYIVKSSQLLNIVLYLTVVAEISALGPQFLTHWKYGYKDRPVPWIMSGLGYCLSIFLIPEGTLPNLTVPLLGLIYLVMSIPLLCYVTKNKIPFKKWF